MELSVGYEDYLLDTEPHFNLWNILFILLPVSAAELFY